MKVCMFTQQFGGGWSGVGSYATNLAAGLVDLGAEITVVCPVGPRREVKGVEVFEVAMKGWEHRLNYWLPLAWRFGTLMRMRSWERRGFRVVHFVDAREALFAPRGSTPLVGTVNDYYPAACPLNPLELKPHYAGWPARWVYWRGVRLLEPTAYLKLDRVVSNSAFVARVMTDNYGIDADRIDVINYGIDPVEINDPIRLDGDPSILFVGTNFQRKGLPDLVRAVARAKEALPGIMLHVVGKDPKQGAIEKKAEELGLLDSIRFYGGRPNDEVRRMVPNMFIMPSLIEGFGIVFIEAMLAGIPVIGGRTGGTIELIEDGRNGFTVAPGDVEDLGDKIVKLTRDADLRERFIREGRSTASQYSVRAMAEKTLRLYEKVVA